jgi:hypothetical protein
LFSKPEKTGGLATYLSVMPHKKKMAGIRFEVLTSVVVKSSVFSDIEARGSVVG